MVPSAMIQMMFGLGAAAAAYEGSIPDSWRECSERLRSLVSQQACVRAIKEKVALNMVHDRQHTPCLPW
jgi:hypothetical protein